MCLMCALLFVSCESDYNRLVNDELKSGIVTDELVLGMKMGQTQKDFFAICWELNKQQKISQGSGNNYAKYVIIPDSSADMTKKVEMLFYGMFDRNKVIIRIVSVHRGHLPRRKSKIPNSHPFIFIYN